MIRNEGAKHIQIRQTFVRKKNQDRISFTHKNMLIFWQVAPLIFPTYGTFLIRIKSFWDTHLIQRAKWSRNAILRKHKNFETRRNFWGPQLWGSKSEIFTLFSSFFDHIRRFSVEISGGVAGRNFWRKKSDIDQKYISPAHFDSCLYLT